MVKTLSAVLLLAAILLMGVAAVADALPGQGQPCTPAKGCSGKLRCVARKGAPSTCERTCSVNADCPADQRCVRDLGVLVCRAISDEDVDYKRPSF